MRAHEYFRASFRYNDFRIIVVIPQSPGLRPAWYLGTPLRSNNISMSVCVLLSVECFAAVNRYTIGTVL